IEYQREGYEMFQSMMSQIKEESVGFLYNLEVEVRSAESGEVDAKGLTPTPVETQKLEYSAPSDTGSGEVEVRNDRGQVQKSATAKARQHAAEQEAPADAPRGAFGQKTGTAEDAGDAGNRAARRAAGKKK
ncbi:MAG: preprotein translocase subunit SecA, partial [Microbacterium sp.]|nr:preprotein translocase subunit SecA [Microbacterium sp.]